MRELEPMEIKKVRYVTEKYPKGVTLDDIKNGAKPYAVETVEEEIEPNTLFVEGV